MKMSSIVLEVTVALEIARNAFKNTATGRYRLQ
jgi:hypothetical protein